MKRLILMSMLVLSTVLSAQQPAVLTLWPDGAPNSNGITTPEQELEPHRISNVSCPTLTVYPAEHPNGLAVIACPGGAYIRLATDMEGHDMAPWFNEQGITYAVLKYRMPNGHHDVPLSDAHQAIRLMRQHAEEWHINPSLTPKKYFQEISACFSPLCSCNPLIPNGRFLVFAFVVPSKVSGML